MDVHGAAGGSGLTSTGNSSDLFMQLSVPTSGSGVPSLQPGNAQRFFHEIEKATGVSIAWPPKPRMASRSRKDPQISIFGSAEAIKQARSMILVHLDTRKNRVTLKMDIAFTDHSHIIGKGGRSIQKVMDETGCHIHFPDSNRTSTYDKSNQVSIAGTAPNAEQARCRVRELLPVTVSYEIPFSSYLRNAMDQSNTTLINIQRTYGVNVSFRPLSTPSTFSALPGFEIATHTMVLVIIRGSKALIQSFRAAVGSILAELTGGTFRIESTPAIMETEIAAQHHTFVMGRGSTNINTIMKNHNSVITFPDHVGPSNVSLHDSATGGSGASLHMPKKTTVTIKGTNFDSAYNSWLDLLGYLPLVLIFDLPEGRDGDATQITQLMDRLKVSILIKPKAKQNNKSVMVRGCERDSRNLYEVRRQILDLDQSEVPVCCDLHHRTNNNYSNAFVNQHMASPVPFYNAMPVGQSRPLPSASMAVGSCSSRSISHSLVTCPGSTSNSMTALSSTPVTNDRSLSWNSSSPDDVFGPDSRTRPTAMSADVTDSSPNHVNPSRRFSVGSLHLSQSLSQQMANLQLNSRPQDHQEQSQHSALSSMRHDSFRMANGHTPVRCSGKSKSETLPFRSDGSLSAYFQDGNDEARRSTILPSTSRETANFLNTLELLFNRNPMYLPQPAIERVQQPHRSTLHNQQMQQNQPTQQSSLPPTPNLTQVASPVAHAACPVQQLQQQEQQQVQQQRSRSPNVVQADFNDARENDVIMDTVSLSQILNHYSLGRYCDIFEDVNLRQFLNLSEQDLRRRALSYGARTNIRQLIAQLRSVLNLDTPTSASRAFLQNSNSTTAATVTTNYSSNRSSSDYVLTSTTVNSAPSSTPSTSNSGSCPFLND